ncbi:PHP domain-containing protein [Tahibacter sp. UC22_41]|uniref:PHP domain-containing protein n=1 Tax=Tahibacter sp. UC22_41 TaxID=3350178 RepID=UPI0036DB032A
MSDQPIDLAERRRRRAAQQAAADAHENAAGTQKGRSKVDGAADERTARDTRNATEAAAEHGSCTTASTTNDPASSGTALDANADAKTDRYAELHCLSDFSFQRGASSADELFERAKKLGYAALAITDECSLAGIVRAFNASRDHDLPLVIGSELHLQDGPAIVLLVENQDGYSNLCRIITRARLRSDKGEYRVCRADIEDSSIGLLALWLPALAAAAGDAASAPSSTHGIPAASAAPAAAATASATPSVFGATAAKKTPGDIGSAPNTTSRSAEHDTQAHWLRQVFPQRCWIAVELHRDGTDAQRLAALQALAQRQGFPLVAAGDVHMHRRGRRALQDVMAAIRLNTTVDQAGQALFPNGERHLRPLAALQRLYPPGLLAASVAIAQRCRFRLDTVNYEYPHEVVPPGLRPIEHLRTLTWEGALKRWPEGVEEKTRRQLQDELALIEKLKYEHFFLTVHDIVRWARAQEPPILCQGRGSAANSAVCYCLGITSIDPVRSNLLFERFISEERDEPPDIDVDFEHERREEVIQYVFGKYGRDRAALAATVIMYRRKSAARDVGRALGLGDDQLNQLSEAYSHAHGDVPLAQRLRECGFDPTSRLIRQLVALVEELRGSPRHLSQHVGGFVISEHPLHTLVPVENASMVDRTVIQWDKDDLESLRLLKVDCLALGMLTCLRRCFDLLREHCSLDYNLATLPSEDKKPTK